MFQVSHITCNVSNVTCHISHVTCHLSPVTNSNIDGGNDIQHTTHLWTLQLIAGISVEADEVKNVWNINHAWFRLNLPL